MSDDPVRYVKVYRDSLNFDLDGDFDDGIKVLMDRKKMIEAGGATRIRFDTDSNDYEDGQTIWLIGERPETDEEKASRLRVEETRARAREADELRQFEALKKKFGG